MRLMRRVTLLLLSALMMFVMQASSWAFYYDEGNDGDSWATAYVIDSLEDFIMMRDRVNDGTESEGKYYRLETDLDYNRNAIQDYGCIGIDSPFKGHFDGNGHTIHIVNEVDDFNFTISKSWRTAEGYMSLFGCVASTGIAIKNLNITGRVTIHITRTDEEYMEMHPAGLVGILMSGIIENCTFTGNVENINTANYAGTRRSIEAAGLVGDVRQDGVIRDCTFSGTVRALGNMFSALAGGIAGRNSGIIHNCKVLPSSIISAKSENYLSYAGGITFGYYGYDAKIFGCTSNASIEDALYKGGITGVLSVYTSYIPDYLDIFDNTFTGAEYAIGRPQGNPSEKNYPTHEFNGHTYRVFKGVFTWRAAQEECEAMGGHLATITSAEENDFIFSLLDSSITSQYGGVWLGGYSTKEASGTRWQWVTGETMDFTAWANGQPDHEHRGIHTWYGLSGWTAERGWSDKTSGYICEWGDYTPAPDNPALNIAAFERGRYSEAIETEYGRYAETAARIDERSICIVSDNCYLNAYEEPVIEEMIAKITDDYQKIGLTADGNTRLIIRVQSSTPGHMSFSVSDDLGLTIETLDRQKINGEVMVHNTLINEDTYQVSVVLTAPEAFPQSEARLAEFPMTKFNVKVVFRPDNGSGIQTGNLPLELHATPVMLLHGRTSTVEDTFGTGREEHGIKRKLYDAGFKYFACNYNGYVGPAMNLATPDNPMHNKIVYITNDYNYDKIACTRVDIVAHSMGGLMARCFLMPYGTGNKTIRSYYQPSVRRIVTVATPHNGSQAGNYLLWIGPDDVLNRLIPIRSTRKIAKKVLTKKTEEGLEEGDLIDLAMGSNFLRVLSRAELEGRTDKVPMYALYGKIRDALITEMTVFTMASGSAALGSILTGHIVVAAILEIACTVAMDSLEFLNTLFMMEDYDIAVSENSARYGMEGYCEDYKGRRFAHTALGPLGESICMQDEIGERVRDLLKGPVDVFKYGTSSTVNANTTTMNYAVPGINNADIENEEDDDDDADIIEHFTLNASVNSLTVADKSSVIYSASFDKPLEHDMYINIDTKKGVGFVKVANKGAKDFNFTLELSSNDTGIMNVYLFSRGSEDNTLFTSNTQPLIVKPDITTNQITGLEFNTDTIFTIEGSSSALGLYVKTDSGQLHDALLWSRDLTLAIGDESIAMVDGNNRVKGLSLGITTLSASYGDFTASVRVSVRSSDSTIPISEDIASSTDIKPTITTTSLPSGKVGEAYTAQLEASGTSPITWRLDSGRIPGLTLNTLGLLSGTPSRAGTFTLTITASNDAGRDTATLTLTIAQSQDPEPSPSPAVTAPSITTSSVPEGTAGTYYSASLYASGTRPITFALVEGALPRGLSFSSGTIFGTPEVSGSFTFTVRAANSAGSTQRRFTLIINASSHEGQQDEPDSPVPPSITTSNLPSGTKGSYYSVYISASGTQPITLRLTEGRLPGGLSFSGGYITGTPSETGTFTFTIAASNSAGRVESDFTITINEDLSSQDTTPEPSQDSEPETVPDILIGRTRSISSLSTYDIDALSNDAGMIAAVLPELIVNTSGSYNFRNTAIYSNVPAGLPLVWNGFAAGRDSSRADFFNANGASISTVPQDHVINITAYLEAGETYAPVITVTLPNDDDTDSHSEGSSSGGGGGCDSGLAGMIIAVLFFAALRKD